VKERIRRTNKVLGKKTKDKKEKEEDEGEEH
jgi:hypothetical protein